jgi:hypothetical protein
MATQSHFPYPPLSSSSSQNMSSLDEMLHGTSSSEDSAQPDTETSKMYVIWIILAVSILLYLFLSWYDQQLDKRRIDDDDAAEDDAIQNKQRLIKTPHVRRVIFAQAFHANQQTLEIGKNNLKTVHDLDVESGECKVHTEPSEKQRQHHDFSASDVVKESSVLVFHKELLGTDSDSQESTIEQDTTTEKQCVTSGMCAICLEPYEQGETIVWSQDNECQHVYHKDCFLDYLSNKKNTDLKDNPCPTCRRNFCSVCLV